MKKIYSFLTAVMATVAINAQTTTELTSYVYVGTYNSATNKTTWSSDYETLTEPATIENGVVTFTNFLGSGNKVSFTCYDDGSAVIVDAIGDYVEGNFSVGSLGSFTSLYFSNDSNVSLEYYDEEEYGKGLIFTTWGTGAGDELYLETELPEDFEPAVAPRDPRSQKVYTYWGNTSGTAYGILYGDKLSIDLGEDVVTFDVVTAEDGSKSVVYTSDAGYKGDSSGKYYYFYADNSKYTYGSAWGSDYIAISSYEYYSNSYNYLYIYLPTDTWADVEAIDTYMYTQNYTASKYTEYQKLSLKWKSDQVVFDDFLGSKQDLLVKFTKNSVEGIYSLSPYWQKNEGYSCYEWTDDTEGSTLAFYPWFDGVASTYEAIYYPEFNYRYTDDYGEVLCICGYSTDYDYYIVYLPDSIASVKNITVDNSNAPVEFYNLNGVRVNESNMAPGLYIRRQGTEASKVIVK
jgi:hypothetical protein